MVDTMVSIRFPVEGAEVEVMHAIRRADGLFILDNSPFHAYGVSFGDVFSAVESEEGGVVFSKVVERGGHSTYRVRLREGEGHDFFIQHWSALGEIGCTYEGSGLADRRLYSIDIPPSVSVDKVYALLEQGEQDGVWEFEEAHYSQP